LDPSEPVPRSDRHIVVEFDDVGGVGSVLLAEGKVAHKAAKGIQTFFPVLFGFTGKIPIAFPLNVPAETWIALGK